MKKISLFFDSENIDVRKDIVDRYLMGVDEHIKSNPSFEDQLRKAISSLIRRKNYFDKIPPLELYVSDDGKSFDIRTPIIKDPDCMNEDLADNKHWQMIKFSVDEKTNGMDVTMLSGTLFRYDDFMKVHKGTEYGKKYEVFNSHDTPTVLSVYHTNSGFLESGVEVCRSSYSDEYPLGMSMDNERELLTQITYHHAPQKWNFNLVPDSAQFEFNPQKSNGHRFINELGLITFLTTSGKGSPVQAAEYVQSTEYPEVLGGNPTPFSKYEGGKPIINPDYASSYPGKSDFDIRKEIATSFVKGIETSKTKDINPAAYEGIRKLARDGLEAKYGVSLENEEEKTVGRAF